MQNSDGWWCFDHEITSDTKPSDVKSSHQPQFWGKTVVKGQPFSLSTILIGAAAKYVLLWWFDHEISPEMKPPGG